MSLCRFVRHQLIHAGSSGKILDIQQQKVPPVPYIFQTPKGLLIDLRLFSRFISFPTNRLNVFHTDVTDISFVYFSS